MNREVCRKVMSPYTHEADYLPIPPKLRFFLYGGVY